MSITLREWLASNCSQGESLNSDQTELLGLNYPLKKGWVRRHGGMLISATQSKLLMALDKRKKKQRKRKPLRLTLEPVMRAPAPTPKQKLPAMRIGRTTIQMGEGFVRSSDFYSSREWRQLRYQALRIHGAMCQACGASPKTGHVMHVDHILPRSVDWKSALELENLQVLCEECNIGKSNWDATDWR